MRSSQAAGRTHVAFDDERRHNSPTRASPGRHLEPGETFAEISMRELTLGWSRSCLSQPVIHSAKRQRHPNRSVPINVEREGSHVPAIVQFFYIQRVAGLPTNRRPRRWPRCGRLPDSSSMPSMNCHLSSGPDRPPGTRRALPDRGRTRPTTPHRVEGERVVAAVVQLSCRAWRVSLQPRQGGRDHLVEPRHVPGH
jgi:hypothetical protein